MMSELASMIGWELGELDEEEERALFQRLIDSGVVWTLQGAYGRRAKEMIEGGECQIG